MLIVSFCAIPSISWTVVPGGVVNGVTDTFSALIVDGKVSGEWMAVRKAKNWVDSGPATDVMSNDIRCFELAPGTAANQTISVTAGSTIGFKANPDIYHPGPLAFYLAKVPAGQTAATFDGSGSVWFKIYEEQPKFGQALSWSSNGKQPCQRNSST